MQFVERLTGAPRRLKARDVNARYRTLRDMAVDGLFPAHQVNQIWHYDVADLDLIAEAWQKRHAAPSLQAA